MNFGWMILIIICSLVILMLLLLLLMNVKVLGTIHIGLKDSRICFQVQTLFGIFQLKREFSLHDLIKKIINYEAKNDSATSPLAKIDKDAINQWLPTMKKPLVHFLKEIKIRKLIWKTELGTGHAAHTGKIVGFIWTLKGMIEAWVHCHLRIKGQTVISAVPNYQRVNAESVLTCMVTFRSGKAISTAYYMYLRWKKLSRRVDDGTSNQRFNDDSNGEFEGNDRRKYDRRRSG